MKKTSIDAQALSKTAIPAAPLPVVKTKVKLRKHLKEENEGRLEDDDETVHVVAQSDPANAPLMAAQAEPATTSSDDTMASTLAGTMADTAPATAPAHTERDHQAGIGWWAVGAMAAMASTRTSAAPASVVAVNNTVTGTVVAGPIIGGNGLKVEIYAANGTTQLGWAALDDTGKFTINIGAYTGIVIARVVDSGTGFDYLDESTNGPKDLNATLMAVAVVPGGTVTLNINPLTAIAAQKAGLAADGSGSLADASAVTNANSAVAAAFGLVDLIGTTVAATNGGSYNPDDGLSESEKYGAILAALSGADQENAGDSQATINTLVAHLSISGASGTLNNQALDLLISGAKAADAHVSGSALKAVGSTLTGSTANDTVTAVAKIANYAETNTNPAPGVADYAAAGVTGVTSANLLQVNKRLDSAERSAADTTPEIQLLVAPAAPIIDSVTSDNTINAAEASRFITGSNEAGSTVTLSIGGNSRSALVNGITWSYALVTEDITAMGQGPETLSATQTDAAGNTSPTGTHGITVDTVAPTITSAATATAINENSGAGQVVYTAVSTDTADTATGATVYSLKTGTGDAAAFSINSGTGAVSLTANPDFETKPSYSFTVVATDAAGNANEQAVSLAINNLDEVAPTISTIAITSASGAQNSLLNAGDVISITVSLDKAVTVTGTPRLALNVGGTTVQADYASGSSSAALVFQYTVVAGQTDNNGISVTANSLSLNNGTIQDVAGNNAALTHAAVADNGSYLVDTAAPTLVSSTPADGGVHAPAANLSFTFSEIVQKGSGNIRLVNDTDATTVTIDIASNEVTVDGDTITINPSANLLMTKAYHIEIDAGALLDAAGNTYAGLTDITALNFTVPDPAVSLNAIASDNRINAAENNTTLTLSGTLSSNTSSVISGFAQADFNVTLNPIAGSPVTATMASYEASTGAWTATVAANTLVDGQTYAVQVLASRNGFTAEANGTVMVDTSIATPTLALASDTGSNSTDGITRSGQITVSGLEAGATWQYSTNAGSNWTAGSGTSFTPDAGSYAANAIAVRQTDMAGNTSTAGMHGQALTVDTTQPAIISSAAATAINENSGTAQVIYTAQATDSSTLAYSLKADTGDAALLSINEATGAVSLTANPDFETKSSYSFTVVATDAAGNASEQAVSLAINNLDEVAPSITITTNDSALKVGETATLTFTLSEAASDFAADDITATGGVLSNFTSQSSTVYTATFTPTANSSTAATVNVAGARFTDAAGNANTASNTVSMAVDTAIPAAPTFNAVATDDTINAAEVGSLITGTNEAGATVALSIGGATRTANVSGTTWSYALTAADITAMGQGAETLSATQTDAAGNTSTPGTRDITVSTTGPSVTITSSASALKVGGTATITFTFSEDPGTTFTDADITTSGGSLGAISGDGLTRTATFTPTAGLASGSASITVAEGGYTNAAGSSGSAGTTPTISIDTVAPTPFSLQPVDGTTVLPSGNLVLTFSEAIAKGTGNIRLVNDTANSTTSIAIADAQVTVNGNTLTLNPTADLTAGSAYHLEFDNGAITDLAGNAWAGISNATDWNFVAISPAISLNAIAVDNRVNATENASTITVSGTVSSNDPAALAAFIPTDFTVVLDSQYMAADVTVTVTSYNGETGVWSGSMDATALEHDETYDVTVTLLGTTGAASGLTTSTTGLITVDLSAPAAPVINAVATDDTINAAEVGSLITGTNEAGATVALSIGGATRTASVSGTTWSYALTAADITAMGQGAETLSATQTDAAGNTSTPGTRSINVDTTPPTVVITSNQSTLGVGSTATLTFTLSEATTDFTTADVAVTGGTLSNFTGSGTVYTATFTPIANSTAAATVNVAGTSFADAAGNSNTAAAPLSMTVNTAVAATDTTPPTFTSVATATAINENSGSGQVIYTAQVTDTSAVAYSLKTGTGDSALMSIDSATGAVRLTTNPDYETKPSYSFTVVATDAAGNASEQAVSLVINDVDESASTATLKLSLATDTGSSATDGITNRSTVNVNGLQAGATWEHSADAGNTWTTGSGSSFLARGDGVKVVQVRQTVDGIVLDSIASLSFTLDQRADTLLTGAYQLQPNPVGAASSTSSITPIPALGDINGDGLMDLVIGGVTTATPRGAVTVRAYLQQLDGSFVLQDGMVGSANTNPFSGIDFAADIPSSSIGNVLWVALIDVDHDGKTDMLVSYAGNADLGGTVTATAGILYYRNTGTATVPAYELQQAANNPFSAIQRSLILPMATGDIDGDGDADLVLGNYGVIPNGPSLPLPTEVFASWRNNGDGTFSEFSGVTTSSPELFERIPAIPYLGDFSGDGKTDFGFYMPRFSQSNPLYYVTGDGLGGFSEPSGQVALLTTPYAATADINGDGLSDFAMANGTNSVSIYHQTQAVGLDSGQVRARSDGLNAVTYDTANLKLQGNGAEAHALIEVLVNDQLLNSTQANAQGQWRLVWTGQETGFAIAQGTSYAITVKQTDIAGNTSSASSAYRLTVASTPTLADLGLSQDTGTSGSDFITMTASQTVTATLSRALLPAERLLGWMNATQGWVDITAKVTGTTLAWDGVELSAAGTLQVRVDNGMPTNVVSMNYVLDVTAPTMTNAALSTDTGSSATDGITTNAAIAPPTNTETGAVLAYRVKAGTGEFSAWSPTYIAPTTDGAYTVEVRQSDVAGNASSSQSIAFTLDTTAATPGGELAFDTGSSDTDGITNRAIISVENNIENGALVELRIQTGTGTFGNWSTSYTVPTADGAYTVEVRQTDLAGNVSSSQSIHFTLDSSVVSPTIDLVSADDVITTADIGTSITGMAEANASLGLRFGSTGSARTFTADNTGAWHYTITAADLSDFAVDGANKLYAVQTDVAGNLSQEASRDIYVDARAPTASVFSAIPAIKLGAQHDSPQRNEDPQITSVGTDGDYVVTWGGHDGSDTSIFVQKFKSDGTPVGQQVKLEASNYTAGADYSPQVTEVGHAGEFVVAWFGENTDTWGTLSKSIYVQKFTAEGAITGNVVVKLDYASDAPVDDVFPQITALPSGAYVVTWHGHDPSARFSVIAQKFNPDGTITGHPMLAFINDSAFMTGYNAQITRVGAGDDYVLTWTGRDPYTAGGMGGDASIYVQKVSSNGSVGALVKLEVANFLNGRDEASQITALGDTGAFVVTWVGAIDAVNSFGNRSIFVQQFNADGSIGANPQVKLPAQVVQQSSNDFKPVLTALDPQVAMVGSDGAYVVVWSGLNSDGVTSSFNQSSIYVQKFDNSGVIFGTTPVELNVAGVQYAYAGKPQILSLGSGGEFVVAWTGKDAGGDYSIFVQKFNANGTTTNQVQVQLEATGVTDRADESPQLAAIGSSGEFVVTWSGQNSDRETHIYVQKFTAEGTIKFDTVFTPDAFVKVQSTELGTAYLVHAAVQVSNAASITGANELLWNQVAITAINTPTAMPTTGLVDGSYRVYTMDASANLSLASTETVRIDGSGPRVTAIEFGGHNNSGIPLSTGRSILVAVDFDEAVFVTGTPQVEFVLGSTRVMATYLYGSGTDKLTFRYVVQAGDNDSDGLSMDASSISLNGGTIADALGNLGTAAFFRPIAADARVRVDTTAPVALLTTASLADTVNAEVQSSELGMAYLIADSLLGSSNSFDTITVNNIPTAANHLWNSVPILAADTPTQLNLEGLAGGGYRLYAADAAGNLSAVSAGAVTVVPTVPRVMGMVISGATGMQSDTLNAGDVVSVTVTMSEETTVNGTPQLALNVGGTTVQANYVSGSGTTDLVFSYRIALDNDATGISIDANSLSLNGGTMVDAATNAAVLTSAAVADNPGFKVDTTAPNASMAAVSIANNGHAVVQSSEVGKAYLVRNNIAPGHVEGITSLADARWNEVDITTANAATNLSVAGLEAGVYKLYTADAAGNLSAGSSNTVLVTNTASATQINLTDATVAGNEGGLIAPVFVDGHWFMYWDRSGDGTSAETQGSVFGAGTGNGSDRLNHNDLDAIFRFSNQSELNPGWNSATPNNGSNDTTNVYRFGTLNGIKLALPTHGDGGGTGLRPGTNIDNSPAGEFNSTYNDLLAIWDAYNGAATTTGTSGVPTSWASSTSNAYWSATPGTPFLGSTANIHLGVILTDGRVNSYGDAGNGYAALQVL